MYGNNYIVKGYNSCTPINKEFADLEKAKKFAEILVSKGYYEKSEIYLVNPFYDLGDYLVKSYHAKNYIGNKKRSNKNV